MEVLMMEPMSVGVSAMLVVTMLTKMTELLFYLREEESGVTGDTKICLLFESEKQSSYQSQAGVNRFSGR
jgi:hypothetical protein